MALFLPHLCAALLAASPSTGVAVTRRMGLDPVKAGELADRFGKAIAAQNLAVLGAIVSPAKFLEKVKAAGVRDPSTCAGAAACSAGIARAADLQYVVATQMVGVGGSLAFDARLVDAKDGAVLASVSGNFPGTPSDKELADLAQKLCALVKIEPAVAVVPEPVKVPDVPRVEPPKDPVAVVAKPELVPKPTVDGPGVDSAAQTPAGRKAAVGLGVAGLALVGAGGVLGLVTNQRASVLRELSPDYVADKTNVKRFALGTDLAFATGGLLLTGALTAWLMSPAPPAAPAPVSVKAAASDTATFE